MKQTEMWTYLGVAVAWAASFCVHQCLSTVVKKLTLGPYARRVKDVELVDLIHDNVPSMQL